VTGERIYRQTQIAWPTIVPLAAVAGIIVPIFLRNEFTAGLWIFGVVWTASLLLFATLAVTVTSDGVQAAFGLGLVRKTLMFADVVSFAPVRNSWAYGWGIHYFPGGVIYNASGLSAIEFRMSSGRYVRIGTAEPDALAAALGQAIGPKEAPHEPSTWRRVAARQAIGLFVGVVAVALTGWTLYTGFQPPAVTISGDAFSVSNGFYRNTVPFDAMKAVTLENELPRIGLKTNGFNTRNTLRGSFRVDNWGASRLYVNLDAPPFVVIRTDDTHVVVNFTAPERTLRLFEDLRTHLARNAR
jgi:hypothetical protein